MLTSWQTSTGPRAMPACKRVMSSLGFSVQLGRLRNGRCASHLLGAADSCSDLLVGGEPWKDKYGRDCARYVKMEDPAVRFGA